MNLPPACQRHTSFWKTGSSTTLKDACSRGKVEASVSIQLLDGGESEITLNLETTRGYLTALREAAAELDLMDDLRLSDLISFPDIFTVHKTEIDPDEMWAMVEPVAREAVDAFVKMRETEGAQLKIDLQNRLRTIAGSLQEIEERAPKLKDEYYSRLYQKIAEVLADQNIDESRLITEAAIFADKVAIDEETVRLRSHLAQFHDLLESDEPVGRKLDFLVQELNREANTIGSKCQDVSISRRVIDIKSEIEKDPRADPKPRVTDKERKARDETDQHRLLATWSPPAASSRLSARNPPRLSASSRTPATTAS